MLSSQVTVLYSFFIVYFQNHVLFLLRAYDLHVKNPISIVILYIVSRV